MASLNLPASNKLSINDLNRIKFIALLIHRFFNQIDRKIKNIWRRILKWITKTEAHTILISTKFRNLEKSFDEKKPLIECQSNIISVALHS